MVAALPGPSAYNLGPLSNIYTLSFRSIYSPGRDACAGYPLGSMADEGKLVPPRTLFAFLLAKWISAVEEKAGIASFEKVQPR